MSYHDHISIESMKYRTLKVNNTKRARKIGRAIAKHLEGALNKLAERQYARVVRKDQEFFDATPLNITLNIGINDAEAKTSSLVEREDGTVKVVYNLSRPT